jgi:hypothetical protein
MRVIKGKFELFFDESTPLSGHDLCIVLHPFTPLSIMSVPEFGSVIKLDYAKFQGEFIEYIKSNLSGLQVSNNERGHSLFITA